MKNKRIVNQLKKFGENDEVKITLTMARKTLTEICYHKGDWNKKPFICDSITCWRNAELFTENNERLRAITYNNYACLFRKTNKLRNALSYLE